MLKLRLLCVVLIPLVSVGCMTPGEKEEMNDNIFSIQTRLLRIENQMKGGSVAREIHGKSIASSSSQVDKLQFEVSKIKGEIDILRIGVLTGEIPGATSGEGNSIAKTLAEIQGRMAKIESNQASLMAAIDQSGRKKSSKGQKSGSSKVASIKNLKEMQKSFDAKRYKYVVQAAPGLLKKSKGQEKHEILFLFAESLYKLGRLRDAALRYNEFLGARTKTHQAHAKMRMGDCFRHLGDLDTAKLYYQDLLSQFPSTAEAEKAKERLKKM